MSERDITYRTRYGDTSVAQLEEDPDPSVEGIYYDAYDTRSGASVVVMFDPAEGWGQVSL